MIQTVLKIGEQISPSRIENYKKKRAIILSKIPFYKSLPEDSMPILLIFFFVCAHQSPDAEGIFGSGNTWFHLRLWHFGIEPIFFNIRVITAIKSLN